LRDEERGDLGGFWDDREGAELARAERTFKRIDPRRIPHDMIVTAHRLTGSDTRGGP